MLPGVRSSRATWAGHRDSRVNICDRHFSFQGGRRLALFAKYLTIDGKMRPKSAVLFCMPLHARGHTLRHQPREWREE